MPSYTFMPDVAIFGLSSTPIFYLFIVRFARKEHFGHFQSTAAQEKDPT
jgi:hypothetical protein